MLTISPRFLPEIFDPQEVFPEPQVFDHVDRGQAADDSFSDLLSPGITVDELTPVIGTEIKGVQLSSLSDRARGEPDCRPPARV